MKKTILKTKIERLFFLDIKIGNVFWSLIYLSVLFPKTSYSQLFINDTLKLNTGSYISVKEQVITNNGVSNFKTGKIILNSDSSQTILGSNPIIVDSIKLDNTKNLILQNGLIVNSHFEFANGKVSTDVSSSSRFLGFLDNATYTGYSSSMFVDGFVKKIGNDAFTFPVGNNSYMAPISISSPSNVTDEFMAYYKNSSNPYNTSSKDLTLNNVGMMEYWMLNRTIGTSSITVSPSWDTRSGGVNNISDLRVAHWDGTKWNNVGNTSSTGSVSSGTITSGLVSSFSPFTLASISSLNALPVKLTKFEVSSNQSKLENHLLWTTSSEKNVDRYDIERSEDAKNWLFQGMVKAIGNSTSTLIYSFLDEFPLMGYNYYRLKMVDNDGKIEYSEIKYAIINEVKDEIVSVYPIPISEGQNINIKTTISQDYSVYITDILGKRISPNYQFNKNFSTISLDGLSKGVYYLIYQSNTKQLTFKILKR